MKRLLLSLLTVAFLATEALSFQVAQVSVKRATAHHFILDHNKPCASGPRAAHVAIELTNLSPLDTLRGLHVKLDSIKGAGFTLLGPSRDSTYPVRRIMPNDSASAYFYISYPCISAKSADFYFTIFDQGPDKLTFNTTIVTEAAISAQSGGHIMDQDILYIDLLGSIVVDTVNFKFGNIEIDDEIEFQPNGDTSFNANDLQLFGIEILSSSIPLAVPVGVKDHLFFTSSAKYPGNSHEVEVAFYYRNSLISEQTVIKPYAMLEGGSRLVYSDNFGDTNARVHVVATDTANQIRATKSASCSNCLPGDTITYTISIRNEADKALVINHIDDHLPQGYTFIAFNSESDINKNNSSIWPDPGDSGKIHFHGYVPETPFPFLSYLIQPNDSIRLIIDVKAPSADRQVEDTNFAFIMINDQGIDTPYAITCIGCTPVPVKMISFKARRIEGQVVVDWTVAQEVEVESYMLYRSSSSNEEFDFVYREVVDEPSLAIRTYHFADQGVPLYSRIVYRLDQRDLDGSISPYYTQLLPEKIQNFQVYPNPTNDVITIVSHESIYQVRLEILDIGGRLMLKKELSDKTTKLGLTELNAGIYLLKFYVEDQVVTQRLLKN